jgi:hypothetical protein
MTVAKETLKRFVSRAARLYEQEPGEPYDSSRLGVYVKRWLRWVGVGLKGLNIFDANGCRVLATKYLSEHRKIPPFIQGG